MELQLEPLNLPSDQERAFIIAGPCSAETEEQVMTTAKQLAGKGCHIFRAGVWKPRTKPGGFEGHGEPALAWLADVKKETGMLVATEVATPEHVELALKYGVDILWVGARTTANPFAVQALADALLTTAERGVKVVALIDDAYYGLFFDPACQQESLFCKIAGKSRNLLAIKADAATKECYVWGLRTGFLSFAIGGAENDSPLFSALEAKTAGLIRATISNCSALSQKIITKALTSGKFYEQRAANVAIMHERCNAVTKTLAEHPEYREQFIAYPFNSGYFMCLKILKTTTAKLRRRLLDHYATGGIAMSDTDFRLAFSCVEKEQIPELFATIYQACKDLA